MPSRGERRAARDRAIARRVRDAKQADPRRPLDEPGRFAKHDTLGHCSNRGCWVCALERNEKRENARRARRRPLPDPEE